MSVTKDIRIKTGASTYDTRDIGAEAQYVDVSRDSNGNIIEDITEPGVVVASTEPLSETLGGMQEKLTFDSTPTSGSNNPVTSGGIYTAIQADSMLSPTSEKPVQNKVVTTALGNKIDLSMIGTQEPIGNVPSVPYKTGSYLVGSDRKLYRVTQDIAITDNITIGTNIEEEPVVVGLDRIQPIETELVDMNNILGAKNLLPCNLISTSASGITITVNNDNSITLNGTASATVAFEINQEMPLDSSKSYILNGCADGGELEGYRLDAYEHPNGLDFIGIQTTEELIISNKSSIVVRIRVTSGTVISNKTFKPMLRLASDPDDTYQPYAMTNQQITPYVQSVSNPNLLDNPWFTVNQRGQSSYTSDGYTVDRWTLARASVAVQANKSLNFTWDGTGVSGIIGQFLEDWSVLNGKTVTASAIIDDTLYSVTFSNVSETNNQKLFELGIMQLNFPSAWGRSARPFQILIDDTTTHNIKAVKLELGSVSTLAMDTAPNYASELLKCQRYFYKTMITIKSDSQTTSKLSVATNTNFLTGVDFPVQMRVQPAYSNVKAQDFFDTVFIDNIVFETSTEDGVCRFYKQNAFTTGTWYYMQFEASADL